MNKDAVYKIMIILYLLFIILQIFFVITDLKKLCYTSSNEIVGFTEIKKEPRTVVDYALFFSSNISMLFILNYSLFFIGFKKTLYTLFYDFYGGKIGKITSLLIALPFIGIYYILLPIYITFYLHLFSIIKLTKENLLEVVFKTQAITLNLSILLAITVLIIFLLPKAITGAQKINFSIQK